MVWDECGHCPRIPASTKSDSFFQTNEMDFTFEENDVFTIIVTVDARGQIRIRENVKDNAEVCGLSD